MNATKRKFNALLNGFGARSSPSVSSQSESTLNGSAPSPAFGSSGQISAASQNSSSTMPFLATASSITSDILKRRRTGAAPSTAPTQDDSSSSIPASTTTGNGASAWSTVRLRKTGATATQDKTSLTTPRYCPGDRDQLIKRLATFQEITDWTPKPDRVNEIEWAKRGWICQGKERVRCTLCNKELVVKLNRKEVDGKEVPVLIASEIEEALVDKYVELMVTSHQEDCLWRKCASDDHLIRLALAQPQVAIEGLRKRYDELCQRKDFLPYEFNLRLPPSLDLDEILRSLPPNFFAKEPDLPQDGTNPPPKINRAAFALALLGWQGLQNPKIGAVPNSASCHSCLRRLGLWMFKSKEVDPETNEVLVPAMMDHLDPLREHRFFCPWKNGDVQRNPGGGGTPTKHSGSKAATTTNPAGWEVLAQCIRNDAIVRRRTAAPTGVSSRLFGHHKGSKSVGGQPGAAAASGISKTTPTTPVRPTTSAGGGGGGGPLLLGPDLVMDDADEEDEATRNAKDKERWARLRRVKSLFDTKGTKKLRRGTTSTSRPGTGHSSSVATLVASSQQQQHQQQRQQQQQSKDN